jgi:CcmD family protein
MPSIRSRLIPAIIVVLFAWLLSGGVILASGTDQEKYDREGNLPFLFAVYTITWIAFFAYSFYMGRQQRELRQEIDELKITLEKRDASRSST